MKSLSLLGFGFAAASAVAAEPLFVPPLDSTAPGYAYVQPGTPLLQPQPEVQFGAPAPLPGNTGLPYAQPGLPVAAPAMLPSYPLSLPTLPTFSGVAVPLYPNVKVQSAHLAWPGGVSEVVQIPNPLPRSGNCEPVYVSICVPPGCQPQVTVGPRGQRVTYAFGGYRVEVTSLRGVVTIDYDRR